MTMLGSGKQVEEMTMALIDAAHDHDSGTSDIIANAIYDLGRKTPELVLSSCHSYLKKHSKLSLEHRVIVLSIMERVLKLNLESVKLDLANNMIKQASAELTQSKEVSPEWQTAASGVLVALGAKYCDEVMTEMLEKFQPGVLPHFFVVQTIGNLASANVYNMVPHLSNVLGTMLPMLGLAKYDNMRWVFASALSKFSEAILEYCANLDQAPDKTISTHQFSAEIFSAYDILFNVWLQSKEVKLRLTIIEAVGHMTHVMSHDKLQEQLPKILQGIIALYKRHSEPYHITRGLCMVLDAVVVEGSVILEPYLDNVLNILFPQIYVPVDINNMNSVRNHQELLRCFANIARSFSAKLVGILLTKMESKDEKIKLGILSIFKHLINAAASAMEDKKEIVVSGLKPLCHDQNNKVCKLFVQVVIAMANHTYLQLEGGHNMIEFIVRVCSLEDDPKGKRSNDQEYTSNQALRFIGDSFLQLVTTTIKNMDAVLWPYLLELILPEQYTNAAGTVCRSLAYMASNKRKESADDYTIEYDLLPNIPKPVQLIARLMVLAGRPRNGRNRGIHVLELMLNLSPNLADEIVGLWDAVIPKLISYLEEICKTKKKGSQTKTKKKSEDNVSPSQTEKNSEDNVSPSKTEKKSEDNVSPSQTEKESEDNVSPSQTEKKSEDNVSTSQTEKKSEDNVSPSQTEKKSEDNVSPSQTKKKSKNDESGEEEEEKEEREVEKWSQQNWEDLLLKMLSKTLDIVDDEAWIVSLGEAFGQQVPLYHNLVEERNFAFKCLGIIMRKSTKKDFVNRHIDLIFNTVKHVDQVEREGCAIAMGYTASSHLDTVLSKLENVAKNEMNRKSSGILSILKDRSDVNPEQIKATLMLCYGFVALYSPPSLIISRMEATILRTINPYFPNVKDASVKQNLIRCADLIAKALHVDHLEQEYKFSSRGEFLVHMQNYMKSEPTTHLSSETRTLCMNTCIALVKLDPRLTDAEVFDLLQTCTDVLYPLSASGLLPNKKKADTPDEITHAEELMHDVFNAFHSILKEVILKDTTPNVLETLFKHLVPWMSAEGEVQRTRALETWKMFLQFYLEHMEVKLPTNLLNEGIFIGRLVPRCSDPIVGIRQLAVDCIHLILQIAQKSEGQDMTKKDQHIDALPTLKDRLKKDDASVLFSVVNDMSKVLAKKIPADHLLPLMEVLQQGLVDVQSHSSSGACVVFNGIMKLRGAEIRPQVESMLAGLYDKLLQITCPQTQTGTLRSVRTMAGHHLVPTLTSLLTYSLPYEEHVVEIWKTLFQDNQMTSSILDHFLELLLKSLPYEEKPDKSEKGKYLRTATVVPLAVTYALTEMFKVDETQATVSNIFPRVLAALMVRVGSAVGVKPPKEKKSDLEEIKVDKKKKGPVSKDSKKIVPVQVSITALKTFLEHTKMTDMLDHLEQNDAWTLMEDEDDYPEAITLLARALVIEENETHIGDIVNSLTSILSSLYETQRITVAAFFAELINQKCGGNEDLIQLIMNSLLGRLVDESHIVRMLCVRGLGNIASVGKDQVQLYATTILSAMMAGMDDKEDPEDFITIEAMSGLSRILFEIQEEHIRAILINVSLKIRPCFERDKGAVRAQAFQLFGNLSRFGDGPSKAPFLEQIHSNFISLLLHLNDKDEDVKSACKAALRSLGPLMGSVVMKEKFETILKESNYVHYGEFMNDLAKIIIQDFPEKINFYIMGCVSFFKSSWSEIRSNASMFVGFLMGNLPKEKQNDITKEHICSALILLLKDTSPSVRSKAAEAMSLLYDY